MSDSGDFAQPRPGHVAIAGAGLIGLFSALSLAERGVRVTVLERGRPGQGASRAAAGMLAPAFEAAGEAGTHPRLVELCLAAARVWADMAPRLEASHPEAIGYRAGPSLAVASDVSQLPRIEALARALANRGVPFERLDAQGIAHLRPALRRGLPAGLLLPTDGQVDNRAVIATLLKTLVRRGVRIVSGVDAQSVKRTPAGFLLPDGAPADAFLDARGWRAPGMQPVKGTALALKPGPDLPSGVTRFGSAYLVAQAGRVVLGASVEPGRTDLNIEAAPQAALLRAAERVCPAVRRAEVIERWSGIRPRTQDGAPVIGWIAPRHYLAGGHFRNGVLLAPLTGELVAMHLTTGRRSDLAAAFDPARLAPAPV